MQIFSLLTSEQLRIQNTRLQEFCGSSSTSNSSSSSSSKTTLGSQCSDPSIRVVTCQASCNQWHSKLCIQVWPGNVISNGMIDWN